MYPSIFDDHRGAYQLYVSFYSDRIEFGLSNGSEVTDPEDYDYEVLTNRDEVSVQKIVEAYEDRVDKFWEWNNELTGGDPEPEDYDQMDWFDEVAQHLRRKGQVIFHGAVGTGKTYGALNFSKWWIDRQLDDEESLKDAFEDRVRRITFHPTFSYEDFIQGITAKTKDGNLIYEPESGVFKEMCEEAKNAYEEAESKTDAPRYILIIDEINRGNIPKIFGDTITLIEDDKRLNGDNEMKNELPHSDEQLVVPPNLYIIGTMNTADRSISLVDSAIRRRFRFKSFPPDYEVLYDELGFDGEQDVKAKASIEEGQDLGALSILALKEVNRRIRDSGDLGKGKQIGHSYLIDGTTDELLVESWKNEVLPLLEEYYFGDMDRLREHIFDGKGKKLFDWEEQQIAEFDSEDLRDALSELVEVEGEEE
jgi:5-methylcytosine-specific restriction protein B